MAEISLQHSRMSLRSHASELAPWMKEALNFRTRFPGEREVGSKGFGVVAALDVIGGHIRWLSASLVGDSMVTDSCTCPNTIILR
jgi:hypothetical protein